MRKTKHWFSAFSAVCMLGAACHLDSLFSSGRKGGGGGGGGGGGASGLESVAQLRSDAATPIPTGGSTPEPTIVIRAVVRDTAVATPRVEVEIRPVGTDFQGQANVTSDATPRGEPAVVQVSGLQDNTGYHWQARVVGDTAWQPYGGNPESAADLRVALPVAVNHLTFTQQPTTTRADSTMAPVEVTLKDGQGKTITGFTGTVHLDIAPNANPGGGALGGPQDANAVAGVATFSGLTIRKAGSGYLLEASADGIAAVVSSSFGIKPGAAKYPQYLVQPSNTTPNRPISPPVRVAVLDVYGNVDTSYPYVVYCLMGNDGSPGKNATLEPSGTGRAPNAGIATFENLKIDQVGVGYTLTCSGTHVDDGISAPFDVLVSLP
jgi:hypothetical protein